MKLYEELKKLKAIPFSHSTLLSILDGYKNPNEKIKNMAKSGEIIRIKKELYITGEFFRDEQVCLELLANTICGPSYISLEWALSLHGLIPERVHEITSITTKSAKSYETPLGRFSYTKAKKELYHIGIILQTVNSTTTYMIASKEKALCDKLIYTPNLGISSQKDMLAYLCEDLRIEQDELCGLDTDIVKACIDTGIKKKTLSILLGLLENMKKG